MSWEQEAANLLPPTQAEMDEWADGLVHHMAGDGTLLYFDPEQQKWLSHSQTRSMTSGGT